ncbi:MAG: hypothetical protein ACLU4J_10730 [Butyricimonas paravirosa]
MPPPRPFTEPAANGVIVITTKKGKEGPYRDIRFGTFNRRPYYGDRKST